MKAGLGWLVVFALFANDSIAADRVKLYVKEVPLKVQGREVKVAEIVQEDGTKGYAPNKADGFYVEVINQLKVPTAIHWHGLILPVAMDGVPFVTQDPIPPGGSYKYDFPLKQAGTYWMHSHYALQEQFYNSAPLIIWTPEERAKADKQFVIMLSDFSFTSPEGIMEKLKQGMKMPAKMDMGMHDMPKEQATPEKMAMEKPTAEEVIAQKWDDQAQRFVRATVQAPPAEIDVKYDALLANRRTIDDPEVLSVKPGETVLLRFIAASSATNFYIDTGTLDAEVLAVDGKAVQSLRGNFFQLAIAQRLDLRVTIPKDGGSFPILAQGEGTKMVCGVVLSTGEGKLRPIASTAKVSTAALSNTQEKKLRAIDPLPARATDQTLPVGLGGNMATYTWTINDAMYPNRKSLDVREGQRVDLVFTNTTNMGHPMHLHGHDFQVVEIDGEKIPGALRDTVLIPPGSNVRVAFDANNPGLWAFHCHLIYHMAAGMFTVIKYDGADLKYWQPEKEMTVETGLTPSTK